MRHATPRACRTLLRRRRRRRRRRRCRRRLVVVVVAVVNEYVVIVVRRWQCNSCRRWLHLRGEESISYGATPHQEHAAPCCGGAAGGSSSSSSPSSINTSSSSSGGGSATRVGGGYILVVKSRYPMAPRHTKSTLLRRCRLWLVVAIIDEHVAIVIRRWWCNSCRQWSHLSASESISFDILIRHIAPRSHTDLAATPALEARRRHHRRHQ